MVELMPKELKVEHLFNSSTLKPNILEISLRLKKNGSKLKKKPKKKEHKLLENENNQYIIIVFVFCYFIFDFR